MHYVGLEIHILSCFMPRETRSRKRQNIVFLSKGETTQLLPRFLAIHQVLQLETQISPIYNQMTLLFQCHVRILTNTIEHKIV